MFYPTTINLKGDGVLKSFVKLYGFVSLDIRPLEPHSFAKSLVYQAVQKQRHSLQWPETYTQFLQ